MDFQYLQTFCSVVSEGNMTLAASKLKITQPAVSQQIRHLEKEFGVKLLVRASRKIQPTIQGQLLFQTANKILNQMGSLKHSIQAISLDLSGEDIRLSTINSIGMNLVSPVMANFLKLSQQMTVSLLYGTGEAVIQKMKNQEVDLVLMPDLKQEYGRAFPSFRKVFLLKEPLYFVGSGKDQNLPKSMQFKDLSSFRLIQVEDHFPRFENTLHSQFKELKQPVNIAFRSDNIGTVKRVIESGLGCGFLPAHSIRKQLRLGRLKVIDIEDFSYQMNLNFYFRVYGGRKDKIMDVLNLIIRQHAQLSY